MAKPLSRSDVEVLPDPLIARPPSEVRGGLTYAYKQQKLALDSEADLLMFGGAAGTLKTHTALLSLIQERQAPRMSSYFFRRTYDAMEEAMTIAGEMFPQTGARSVDRHKGLTTTWVWPNGGTFRFRQLRNQADLENNWGKEMSAIAFDESTQWEEKYPRTILTRNRSSDSSLKIRAIFTTNPGNVGAKWHKRLWMGGVCPHCEPTKAPPQYELRWDARWPEYDRPLEGPDGKYKLSVAYILARIEDHKLLGPEYIAKLHMQSPALAKALLAGCWEATEGQFFDIWDYASMTVDRKHIGEEWWTPGWLGVDYGFSISAPAACLFKHAPETPACPGGVVYMVDEMGGHDFRDKTAKGFAGAIVERWVTDGSSGLSVPERRWMPWYLSPDAWSEHGRAGGVSFNLAHQMNEIVGVHQLGFARARNDRVGGWMKIYSALKDGELKICRNCTKTIEALQTRKKDPDREGDVDKISGDELDDFADACLVAGTLVETENGPRAIESVRDGDRVWTRAGLKTVLWAGMTNPDTPLVHATFKNGASLSGTAGHPVFTEHGGFRPLDTLRYGDNVLACVNQENHECQASLSSSTGSRFDVIPTVPGGICVPTSGLAGLTGRTEWARYTKRFGNLIMGLFHQVTTSTTKTRTRSTMRSTTLISCLSGNIDGSTLLSEPLPIRSRIQHTWREFVPWRVNGTVPLKDVAGTPTRPREENPSDPPWPASTARKHFRERLQRVFAQMLANLLGAGRREWTTSSASVHSAESGSWPTSTRALAFAHTPVTSLTTGGRAAVYNLTVEGQPEFFANGILVHNCRYGYYSWATEHKSKKPRQAEMEQDLAELWKKDPTSAVLYRDKMQRELDKEKQPQAYGGTARQRMRGRKNR